MEQNYLDLQTYKDILATQCAIYGYEPINIGTPRSKYPNYELDKTRFYSSGFEKKGLSAQDLQPGYGYRMRIRGETMVSTPGSPMGRPAVQDYDTAMVVRVADFENERAIVALRSASQFDDRSAVLLTTTDLFYSYNQVMAMSPDRLALLKELQSIVPKVAKEQNSLFWHPKTNELAKAIGLDKQLASHEFRNAFSQSATELMQDNSFKMWSNNDQPEFLLSWYSLDPAVLYLYGRTSVLLQQELSQTTDVNKAYQLECAIKGLEMAKYSYAQYAGIDVNELSFDREEQVHEDAEIVQDDDEIEYDRP